MRERAGASTNDLRLRSMVNRLQQLNTRTVATATTLTEADDVVVVDTTSGSVTITPPLAALGKTYLIQKSVAANTLTFDPAGSETVNGAATKAWTTQWEAHHFFPTSATTWGSI